MKDEDEDDPMRHIVHLDADAFFASVEQAADARLRGKPMAVGGERRGIIASASYEARRFGVYTPMPTARAPLKESLATLAPMTQTRRPASSSRREKNLPSSNSTLRTKP